MPVCQAARLLLLGVGVGPEGVLVRVGVLVGTEVLVGVFVGPIGVLVGVLVGDMGVFVAVGPEPM